MIEQQPQPPPRTINSTDTAKSRLWRYGPVVIWAILIFIASGDALSANHTSVILVALKWLFPSASSESLNTVHFLVRKAGHLSEYAVLATLAAYAFRRSSHQLLRLHWFWCSLLLAVVYALTDEYHQSFIPSRTSSIYDSLIDSTGALIALTVIWLSHQRRRRQARLTIPIERESDGIKLQPAKSYET